MEEQLISFETAKLAKEKGFNEPCSGFIEPKHNDVLLFIDDICMYVYPGYNPIKDFHEILGEGWLLAPNQSLLQKWLRDEHNIHIIVNPTVTNHWTFALCNIGNEKIQLEGNVIFHKYDYNTYEEALEIGLQEALKLI